MLPYDVLREVFSTLTRSDLDTLSLVCASFASITAGPLAEGPFRYVNTLMINRLDRFELRIDPVDNCEERWTVVRCVSAEELELRLRTCVVGKLRLVPGCRTHQYQNRPASSSTSAYTCTKPQLYRPEPQLVPFGRCF